MSLKKFFIVLFTVSLAIALFIQFYPQIHTFIYGEPQKIEHPNKHAPIQKTNGLSLSIKPEFSTNDDFILIVSLITSMLSFLGFVLSSYYSIKGNRREEVIFDLQKEKEQLEMEKIRSEIQALRKKNNID